MRTSVEALFDAIVSDGWANQSDGEVDSPFGHFALVVISDAELGEVLDAFTDTTDVYGVPDHDDIVGAFIVTTTDQGFIYVTRYDSEHFARSAYAGLADDYSAWCEALDDSELPQGD